MEGNGRGVVWEWNPTCRLTCGVDGLCQLCPERQIGSKDYVVAQRLWLCPRAKRDVTSSYPHTSYSDFDVKHFKEQNAW